MALVILLGVTALVVAVMTLPGRGGQVTAARWRRALRTLRDGGPPAHPGEELPDLYHAPEHVRVIPTRGRVSDRSPGGAGAPRRRSGASADRPGAGGVEVDPAEPGCAEAAAEAVEAVEGSHLADPVGSAGPNSRVSRQESGSVSEPRHDDSRWSPGRRRPPRGRKGDRCPTIH